MVRILVVDDDPKFRTYVRSGLARNDIESDEAKDGNTALEILAGCPDEHYDLILLDVMMPGSSGWNVLKELRKRGNETPSIFVTARDAVEERVKGLELGADDYIIKPFDFSELLARIDAVIRRHSRTTFLQCGGLTVDLIRRKAKLRAQEIDFTMKEFDLLLALMRSGGEVMSRSQLLKDVWGIEFDPETNVVDVYIARLRSRLHIEGLRVIHTVRGKGYALEAPPNE